jgi:hypothetical protein
MAAVVLKVANRLIDSRMLRFIGVTSPAWPASSQWSINGVLGRAYFVLYASRLILCFEFGQQSGTNQTDSLQALKSRLRTVRSITLYELQNSLKFYRNMADAKKQHAA